MSNENKRPRGRPAGSKDKVPRKRRTDFKVRADAGELAEITAFNAKWMTAPKVDIKDRAAVEQRILEYFQSCIEYDMRPGVAALCLALGVHRDTWWSWGNHGAYQDLVLKTRAVMEAITEQYMLQGKLNPVSAIFLLKNHFGYKDQSEVVLGKKDPLGEGKTTEQLAKKYLDEVRVYDPKERKDNE